MPHRLRRAPLLLAALLATTLLAACGSDDGDGDATTASAPAPAAGGAFPVTIDDAFGTTTIERAPERVVTLGWSDADVALALGVKPVGLVKTLKEFDYGVGPWAEEALGDARPEVLDDTDGVPFEQVASLRPDLILAVQSGIDQADYDRLSQIAPTVAYAKGREKYLTPWHEQTTRIAEALGRPDEGEQLVAQVEEKVAATADEHPVLHGKTFAYAWSGQAGQLGLYVGDDPRVQLIEDLGMELLPAVAELGDGESFYETISHERADIVDGDVLIAWFSTPADKASFRSAPLIEDLDVMRKGGFVPIDLVLAQAEGAPTPLSIPWALERMTPKLVAAVEG